MAGKGPVALLDRCPHRGAALSEGRMTALGSLQCAYHVRPPPFSVTITGPPDWAGRRVARSSLLCTSHVRPGVIASRCDAILQVIVLVQLSSALTLSCWRVCRGGPLMVKAASASIYLRCGCRAAHACLVTPYWASHGNGYIVCKLTA